MIVPERFDAPALLKIFRKVSSGDETAVQVFGNHTAASESLAELCKGLTDLSLRFFVHPSLETEDILTQPADLAIAMPDTSMTALVHELSRKLIAPLWITGPFLTYPSSLAVIIDPDMDISFDPAMADAVLRTAHHLATALSLPMDVANVWEFPEERLLRSWRSAMTDDEVDELRQEAEWSAQAGFNRVSSKLPRELNWRRLTSVRGPITDEFIEMIPQDALCIIGSHGREGWAASLRRNLAERFIGISDAGTVIIRSPDFPANARLTRKVLRKL